MKLNSKDFICIALLAVAVIITVVFDIIDIAFTADETFNSLLRDFIPRISAGAILIAVLAVIGEKKLLIPRLKLLHRHLLWCLPCVFVVLANFPFTALIGGSAEILRTDLIWLFVLKCLSVGLMEEALFRGLVQSTVFGIFNLKPYAKLKTTAVTAAVFGLFHLLNLFGGAGLGATVMQVGYSFLIGAMLSAVLFKTENLWLCVILHAAFNTGGFIVTELGRGLFQDVYFWIFTAVFGIVCFLHVIYYLTECRFAKAVLCNLFAFKRKLGGYAWSGKEYKGLAYSQVSKSDYLDLSVPDAPEKPPLLIFIHGGGFVEGDTEMRPARLIRDYFRANGYACALVNYRIAGEAVFPAAVEDVKAAVKFLRAHSGEYGYDENKFILAGESAGGYLAAMVAFCGNGEFNGVSYEGIDRFGEASHRVCALADFYGVSEMEKFSEDFKSCGIPQWILGLVGSRETERNLNSFTSRFIGKSVLSLSDEQIKMLSPLSRVGNSESGDMKVYITHGEADLTVPEAQSARLYNECKSVFNNVFYDKKRNCKHGDDRFYTPENLAVLKAFLEK